MRRSLPGLAVPEIPTEPTQANATTALQVVLDAAGEFPCDGDAGGQT